MHKTRSFHLALLAGLLSASFGAGRLLPAGPASLSGEEATIEGARGLSRAFQRVSDEVGQAVVSIRSYREGSRGMRRLAQGSGVIVRADEGIVITNNHVVAGADVLRVQLTDGRELRARVVGLDADSDLAVLRIPAEGLKGAPLAVGDTPPVGEWVLAIGNPFGLGHTVTAGIISGRGRTDLGIATYEDFLQTDAAINPGNSGGPLIDLQGRVVGINTAVGTRADGSAGIGFAIPAHMVRDVMDEILVSGKVRRGWLGVQMKWFPPERAAAVGFDGDSRIAVREVIEDSPAERAGLREDDVLVAIHGRPVNEAHELLKAIADIEPGSEVEVEVWRAGRNLSLPVTLDERQALSLLR